jgi:putative flippase GtrA
MAARRRASRAFLAPWLTVRVLRFVALGLLGTACDLSTFWLLYVRLGAPVLVSAGAAWCIASTALFVASRVWVFPDGTTTLPVSSVRYIALILANGVTTVSIASLLVGILGIPYIAVRIGMSACIIPINYIVSKRWVFEAKAA